MSASICRGGSVVELEDRISRSEWATLLSCKIAISMWVVNDVKLQPDWEERNTDNIIHKFWWIGYREASLRSYCLVGLWSQYGLLTMLSYSLTGLLLKLIIIK